MCVKNLQERKNGTQNRWAACLKKRSQELSGGYEKEGLAGHLNEDLTVREEGPEIRGEKEF